MGGGISKDDEMQAALACTMIISGAMIEGMDPRYVRFPDMYRVYDFHVGKKQHKKVSLETHFERLMACENSVEEVGDDAPGKDTVDEEMPNDVLEVHVGSDTIMLDKSKLNVPNTDGWTVLHACCHASNAVECGITIVNVLVEQKNADLNLKTNRGPGTFSSGWTPLHIASAYGMEPMVHELLKLGANANVSNSVGWTPLHEACHRGFTDIAKSLINHGAILDEMCPPFALCPFPGHFPLAEACRQGHAVTAKMLCEQNANLDAMNELEWTALHESAYHNRIECVNVLIDQGANPLHLTNNACTAEMLTISSDIKNLLRQAAESYSKDKQQVQNLVNISKTSTMETSLLGDLPAIKPISAVQQKQHHHKARRSSKKKHHDKLPSDVPSEFLCDISRKLMQDPVTSPYGNIFERKNIEKWINNYGHQCPMSGQPLAFNQLSADMKTKKDIANWLLSRKNPSSNNEESASTKSGVETATAEPATVVRDEYEF